MPVEVPTPIRFDLDDDARLLRRRIRAPLLADPAPACDRVFKEFRARFIGKCSPVHFFWGSFDLAVTRFSGRPRRRERPARMRSPEAYSHEVISHGFWPGGGES